MINTKLRSPGCSLCPKAAKKHGLCGSCFERMKDATDSIGDEVIMGYNPMGGIVELICGETYQLCEEDRIHLNAEIYKRYRLHRKENRHDRHVPRVSEGSSSE